jgi:hypothetical protein
MASLPEGHFCMIALGHNMSSTSEGILGAQEDDVISTNVAKKGELTHYRWCVSFSLHLQGPCASFAIICR